MTNPLVVLLGRALDQTGVLIEQTSAEQWSAASPCAGWTVTDVVRHLTLGNHLFATATGAEDSPGDGEDAGSAAAFRRSADRLLAAFAAPGVLERPVTVPFGTVPGAMAVQLRLVEALVHGWDIARGTAQPTAFDEETVNASLQFSQSALSKVPPERSPFGPPQPVAATAAPIERLAALLGRTV